MKQCQDLGHHWEQQSADAFVLECTRCGLMQQGPRGLPQWSSGLTSPAALMEEEDIEEKEDIEEEADPHLMCLWCGMVCDDLQALDLHEEECEP